MEVQRVSRIRKYIMYTFGDFISYSLLSLPYFIERTMPKLRQAKLATMKSRLANAAHLFILTFFLKLLKLTHSVAKL